MNALFSPIGFGVRLVAGALESAPNSSEERLSASPGLLILASKYASILRPLFPRPTEVSASGKVERLAISF